MPPPGSFLSGSEWELESDSIFKATRACASPGCSAPHPLPSPPRLLAPLIPRPRCGAQEIDRVRLFVDGAPAMGTVETPFALGHTFTFLATSVFAVGNRDIGMRSIAGTLFYAAIYDRALASGEIAQNVTILQASDDP